MPRMMHGLLVALLALGAVLAGTGHGWAQQATPPAPEPVAADDSPGLTAMAAVAGAIGSGFYIPFKLAVICPGMVLASGVSLAFTGGDSATAEYLLRVGCTGTYFITPGMVRGKEEFQESGTR